MSTKPLKDWCSCGRGFTTRSGMLHHALKCETEQARSAAFIAWVEAGSPQPMPDAAKG